MDLPHLIKKFLPETAGERPTDREIVGLLRATREVVLRQPVLLELEAPVKVVGDLHGQYQDLIRIFEGEGYPPDENYLFLGDYVDRGQCGIEVMCLLCCFKVMYPENVFLLRGNHEIACINRIYGFYDEVKRRYSVKLWKNFIDLFNCLPFAAVVADSIFCVHGGLSPELAAAGDLSRLNEYTRPMDVPDNGLLCDLLWSDPDPSNDGWFESDRGVSYSFGPSVISSFLSTFSFDLIVRAHQVVEDGYHFFSPARTLVTLFSATAYTSMFENDGATLTIDPTLKCSFTVYHPHWIKNRQRRQTMMEQT